MTDTTTAVSGSEIQTAPLEEAIAAALERMGRAAEAAAIKGREDFYNAWTADVMTRQPTIFVLRRRGAAWWDDGLTDRSLRERGRARG